MGSKFREEQVTLQRKLNSFWPELLSEICRSPNFCQIPTAARWLENVLCKNVPGGKQIRALLQMNFYNQLVKNQTEEEKKLCLVAAWTCEISQAAALIADDIMDESETRRGELCWYKNTGVGLSAVNDCLMLENINYFIMYNYCSHCDYFQRLLQHCHDMVMITIMGQCLDVRSASEFDMDSCTPDAYRKIVEYKTSYYTFYHPIAVAMIMARVHDEKVWDQVKEIALEIGYLFQAQDDRLDCFGDVNITGKLGTDIQDSKCTWLLVKALELASESQKLILQSCYGQKNMDAEDSVKQIYYDLEIEEHFTAFEDEAYYHISELINELPKSFPKQPFQNILMMIYRRVK